MKHDFRLRMFFFLFLGLKSGLVVSPCLNVCRLWHPALSWQQHFFRRWRRKRRDTAHLTCSQVFLLIFYPHLVVIKHILLPLCLLSHFLLANISLSGPVKSNIHSDETCMCVHFIFSLVFLMNVSTKSYNRVCSFASIHILVGLWLILS